MIHEVACILMAKRQATFFRELCSPVCNYLLYSIIKQALKLDILTQLQVYESLQTPNLHCEPLIRIFAKLFLKDKEDEAIPWNAYKRGSHI